LPSYDVDPLALTDELSRLLLSSAGATPHIRLLSARKLVEYIDGGGVMVRRQQLEREHPDIFLGDDVVRALLPELEQSQSHQGHMCTFPGITALSYAWVQEGDPDPAGDQLRALRPVLVWYMCERARQKLTKYLKLAVVDFGVFVDFMSIYQPDDWSDPSKPVYTNPIESASFKHSLCNIGLLYSNAGTTVLKITGTPQTAVSDPNRVYERRGWTYLERVISELDGHHHNCIDVSAWPTAEAERETKRRTMSRDWKDPRKDHSADPRDESYEAARSADEAERLRWRRSEDFEDHSWTIRGPVVFHDSEEELAMQADHVHDRMPGTVGTLTRQSRGAPRIPAHFDAELRSMVFGYESDRVTCSAIYRGIAEPALRCMTRLQFTKCAWTDADWQHLAAVLPCCPVLKSLKLENMGVDSAVTLLLFGRLGSDAFPALRDLDLGYNGSLGDEGLRHVADALARGVAPRLGVMALWACRIGNKGVQFLIDALLTRDVAQRPGFRGLHTGGQGSPNSNVMSQSILDKLEKILSRS
jgi:hypothetical protein